MTYLEKVGKLLDLPPAKKSEVLLELKSHMAYICDELIAEAIPPEAAESEAENRMGTPEDVAQRLNAAHNTTSWKTAIYTALPFMMSALIMLLPTTGLLRIGFTVLMGVVTSFLSIREIVRGRRPFWLAPCLAAALFCVGSVIHYVTALTGESDAMFFLRLALVRGLAFALCALTASLVTRKLRKTIVPLFVVQCALTVVAILQVLHSHSNAEFYSILTEVAMLPLVVEFARCIFELHRYGSGIQASLFLLSTFVLPRCLGGYYLEGMVVFFVGIIVLVWVARVSTRVVKVRLLKVAIVFHAAPYCFFVWQGFSRQSNVEVMALKTMITAIYFGILYFVILSPVWSERRREQADPPLAAQ